MKKWQPCSEMDKPSASTKETTTAQLYGLQVRQGIYTHFRIGEQQQLQLQRGGHGADNTFHENNSGSSMKVHNLNGKQICELNGEIRGINDLIQAVDHLLESYAHQMYI